MLEDDFGASLSPEDRKRLFQLVSERYGPPTPEQHAKLRKQMEHLQEQGHLEAILRGSLEHVFSDAQILVYEGEKEGPEKVVLKFSSKKIIGDTHE